MIEIKDIAAPELSLYRGAVEEGTFIAESAQVIRKALDAGCVPISFLAERGQAEQIAPRAGDAPIYVATRDVLSALTGYHLTRGLLCAMRRPAPIGIDFIRPLRRIAFLENVVDPSNVGAIFRCAAALGLDGIVLNERCADPLYRKAVRVSMGTVFSLPWARGTIADIADRGYFTIAMALTDRSAPITDETLYHHDRIAIALGNEGEGLSDHTIAACNRTARIEMHNGVDSLNVATAAAIMFWKVMNS